MARNISAALTFAMALCTWPVGAGEAPNAGADTHSAKVAGAAKAEAQRKKPLQRCDQLADKAQLECLQKARERIVEAREKREASAAGKGKKADKAASESGAAKK